MHICVFGSVRFRLASRGGLDKGTNRSRHIAAFPARSHLASDLDFKASKINLQEFLFQNISSVFPNRMIVCGSKAACLGMAFTCFWTVLNRKTRIKTKIQ